MKLTILGYWGGYPFQGEGTSAYLLESAGFHLLIDCGSASLISLEEKLDSVELDAVILSHYHHDHIADVGVLQFSRLLKKVSAEEGTRKILPIYGHQESFVNFESLQMEGVSEAISYDASSVCNVGPFEITFMRTKHPVPCFAMRILEKSTQKVLVYTADSGYLAEFIPFAKDADVLLADTNFFNGMENHPVHMTSGEVGRIAHQAAVKKLILTHLPQTGSLNTLLEQAKEQAGDCVVERAEKNKIITI
ncbi:MBL fold metallo-hydrolase [Isobaculum melis]|uniref:Ribonuclease BN, tRNA processing enzyme n=1 Tax=Isobaculum melis TaxID=142588 RepID=A0A1H9QL76_9LACT|nr:MBL fold metallo-hydrolase [Isobaculum melis]SER60609.1 Ribonuclease BN, tRNA processing enzyme [Isobaculum melis]